MLATMNAMSVLTRLKRFTAMLVSYEVDSTSGQGFHDETAKVPEFVCIFGFPRS